MLVFLQNVYDGKGISVLHTGVDPEIVGGWGGRRVWGGAPSTVQGTASGGEFGVKDPPPPPRAEYFLPCDYAKHIRTVLLLSLIHI